MSRAAHYHVDRWETAVIGFSAQHWRKHHGWSEVAAIRVLGAGRSFDAALGEDGVNEQGGVFKMEDRGQGEGRRRKVRLGRRVWQVHASGSMAVLSVRTKYDQKPIVHRSGADMKISITVLFHLYAFLRDSKNPSP